MIKVNILLVPGGNMDHVSQIGEIKISRVGPVRGNDAGGQYTYSFFGSGKHHGEEMNIGGETVHFRKDSVFDLISACLDVDLHRMLASQLRLLESRNRYIAALEAEYPEGEGIPASVGERMADPNWDPYG